MEDYKFSGKKENEKILLVIRQHPWVFFYLGIGIIGGLVLYLLSYTYFHKSISWFSLWGTIFIIAIIVYLGIRAWYMWINQVYVVTSDRVISVEQKGWFSKSMSESNLENILFINNEVKGPIKTIFNFGDVRVRASGVVEDELVFYNVMNPYEVQQEIVKAQKEKTGGHQPIHETKEKKEGKVVLR